MVHARLDGGDPEYACAFFIPVSLGGEA